MLECNPESNTTREILLLCTRCMPPMKETQHKKKKEEKKITVMLEKVALKIRYKSVTFSFLPPVFFDNSLYQQEKTFFWLRQGCFSFTSPSSRAQHQRREKANTFRNRRHR